MGRSKSAAKTDNTSRTSHAQPLPLSERLGLGNAVVMAMLYELLAVDYPVECHNIQENGHWVAFLRLPGQMWTDKGELQESKSCENLPEKSPA